MGPFRLYLVCICIISALGQLHSQDIMALLEFKKAIEHDPNDFVLGSWNDESIDFNGCPSSWNGIICNGENVAAIVLDDLGLFATVDLNMFANLTKLAKLSISNNSISGRLPDNLGEFKSLEYLDISNNLFSSQLTQNMGKLVHLKNLSLAGNNFSGQIPDTISGLASIRSLDMSRNSLSGPLPLSLTKLRGLVYLNLSMNAFNQSIPRGFELLPKLDVLDLHGNELDGEFDPQFLLLTTASYVDLSGNLLVSSSREKRESFLVGISPSVNYLNLSHCELTGSIMGGGGEAEAFGSLKVLDLSYNQLFGELPGFSFVYDLQVLRLCNNRFSGYVPNNLLKGGSLVLTELDLSGNNLSGPITTITSTTLHTLNLSSNVLSGELPALTGGCAVIDLSSNQFEGNLTRLLKWGNVQILDLSRNRLTGPIPEETAQFLRLNYLNLSGNSLIGPLPEVMMTSFPKLSVLDLSFNRLDGPLLTNLFTRSTLEELHLQSNRFSGSVNFSPSSAGDFLNLRVLDLSDNRLNGSLPYSICNMTALNSLYISRNNFTGPIPNNLSDTLESFNVSFNDLSGFVPVNLRKFPLSSFYPGNSQLQFPNPPPGGSNNAPSRNARKKHTRTIIIIILTTVACVLLALIILIFLAVFIHRKHNKPQKQPLPLVITSKDPNPQQTSTNKSEENLTTSQKGSKREIISPDEKTAALTGFSPSKTSLSWSPESADSNTTENISKFDVGSPDQMAGELNFLDDTLSFTAEELSRAPAEVLGRSSHGTSYKATLGDGLVLTVKWLREGVAKQRKEFAKEAKRFANIRHPNVVGVRGYYWGPTQHEKLILSDYISPGSLASFLYDRPGRKGILSWAQRLKVSVDVARGLNYLHFDRAVPHGNLKSTNILLDGPHLDARVSDSCLHRLMTSSGTAEQILDAGLLGYRAPELAAARRPAPSFKADVYAFGVVLLEILTGRCAGDHVVVSGEDGCGVDLADWVRLRVAEGRGSTCFDASLAAEVAGGSAADRGMKEVLSVALRCIRSVSERPGIKTVYEDLSSI
ncbi:leucine-rich receptor-like protein kinase family protein [Striga asiatica]|uniref:Leucine-rich receptor-like protein kinase family protein n=1 Tax=Striga asiatica TaxID=4170 RepID=A0A5A7NZU0_STRAF|nr:leucine-rich receptor-like protein kinase family protein [Striga asiatica]